MYITPVFAARFEKQQSGRRIRERKKEVLRFFIIIFQHLYFMLGILVYEKSS